MVSRLIIAAVLAASVLVRAAHADSTITGPITFGTGLMVTGATVTATPAQLTGDATAGPGVGSQVITLSPTGVEDGSYTKLTVNTKGLVVSAGAAVCEDLSNAGSACPASTGMSGHTLPYLDEDHTWSGINTFGTVYGDIGNGGLPVTGTTYTFTAADCGRTVVFTSNSAVTATIPAAIVPAATVCSFGILQAGAAAGKVSVNGSAVTPATLVTPYGFTGTAGITGSTIALMLLTVDSVTNAYLLGAGS